MTIFGLVVIGGIVLVTLITWGLVALAKRS
jgi:hypothetical protein